MKIDSRLNLVVPVETETGTFYVHSTPLGKDVFDANWLLISKAFAAIFTEGLQLVAGPRIARRLLYTVGAGMTPQGKPNVAEPLMEAIRQATNVAVPVNGKFETRMFADPEVINALGEEDVDFVEGAIVFFILNSAMHTRQQAKATIEQTSSMWGLLTTSLDITAYCDSLQTLTKDAPTETAIA